MTTVPLISLWILNLAGAALSLWSLNLVRRNRLYVGYGVIVLISYFGFLILEFFVPAPVLLSLALAYILFLLLYVLVQLTLISNRLVTAVQTLAIHHSQKTSESDPS